MHVITDPIETRTGEAFVDLVFAEFTWAANTASQLESINIWHRKLRPDHRIPDCKCTEHREWRQLWHILHLWIKNGIKSMVYRSLETSNQWLTVLARVVRVTEVYPFIAIDSGIAVQTIALVVEWIAFILCQTYSVNARVHWIVSELTFAEPKAFDWLRHQENQNRYLTDKQHIGYGLSQETKQLVKCDH